jgi:hypothetical protein
MKFLARLSISTAAVMYLLLVTAMAMLWVLDSGASVTWGSGPDEDYGLRLRSLHYDHGWFWSRHEYTWYDPSAPVGRSCRLEQWGPDELPAIGWSEYAARSFLCLPIWPVAAIGWPLPLWWLVLRPLRAHRQRRRQRVVPVCAQMYCTTCGYDLRGATPEGRCPECGAPVGRSRDGHLLGRASPNWLRSLRWGVWLGVVATLAFFARDWSHEHDLLSSHPCANFCLINGLHWLGYLVATVSLLLATRQEPRLSQVEPFWNRRLWIRILAIGPDVVSLCLEPRYVYIPSLAARVIDQVVLGLVNVAGGIACGLLWIGYARRVPSLGLKRAEWISLGWGVLWGAFSLLDDAWSLRAEWLGRDAPDFDWLYEPRHLISDTMAMVISAWWIIVLTRAIRRASSSSDAANPMPPTPAQSANIK